VGEGTGERDEGGEGKEEGGGRGGGVWRLASTEDLNLSTSSSIPSIAEHCPTPRAVALIGSASRSRSRGAAEEGVIVVGRLGGGSGGGGGGGGGRGGGAGDGGQVGLDLPAIPATPVRSKEQELDSQVRQMSPETAKRAL